MLNLSHAINTLIMQCRDGSVTVHERLLRDLRDKAFALEARPVPEAEALLLKFQRAYNPLADLDTDPACLALRKALGLPPLCPHCHREM